MVVTLSIIHGLVLFGFFAAVGIAWLTKRGDIKDCSRFAAIVVGVLAIATLPVVLFSGMFAWFLAFAFVIGLARTFVFTAVGTSYCADAGFAAFPLLRPGIGGLDERNARLAIGSTMVAALVVAGGWCVYTGVLFWAFSPELSDAAERLFAEPEAASGSDSAVLALIALSVVALEEELVFRLGIQNFVARVFGWWDRRYWLAILISATIWTVGHVGMLEPGWVKLAQIFPLGIVLGWLARKHGIEACIVAHVVFNIAVAAMEAAGLIPIS